jgi:arylsulfatase A-like enzyme
MSSEGFNAERFSGKRPNVVLVFMDDMGYGDMSCMGSDIIRTPRMDGVAANGVLFQQMYSAAAICTPSRAALLTGRYAPRVGLPRVLHPADVAGLPAWERTLPELLREQGYHTAVYGKWHLGGRPEHNPTRHGFDEFLGLLYSNDMVPLHLYAGGEVVETDVDQATLTRRYTDAAIDFVERHSADPFFVYLPHTMPHIPLHVEEGFRGRSRAGTYGDTIECIDFHLGRLLDRLEQLGLTEQTMVIVTSDNGPWFEGSTGGLRGRKSDTYEGGIRMPFVTQWPAAVPAGTRCDEPACLIDLLPTLVRLAGGTVPDDRPIDGIDIGPALLGLPMPERGPLYFFHHWTLNAVRLGRWKLHVDRQPRDAGREHHRGLPQLFDLDTDPAENYDLADREQGVVSRLTALARRFSSEIAAGRVDAEARAAGGKEL